MASTTSYKISIEGDASSLKNATGQAEDALGGLDNQIQKTSGGKGNDPLDGIGKKIDMGNLMNAADSVAQVGDKVLDLGKKSIESAANQDAMNETFKQTFGDLTPMATAEVDKLSKAYDILPNRIKPSYQQFTSMFKGLGLSTEEAAGKASQAMRISANAAAFYDKSLEDSNSALQSFVKGNYEGGESIGLFANDTQMAAFAAKNNLIPATEGAKQASEELLIASEKATKKQQEAIQKHGENSLEAREASLKLKDVQDKIAEELGPQTQKWADLDEKTKQAARLEYAENMLQQAGAIDKVGEMAGQASREAGSYENQMGNMQQSMEDLYATIGKEILPTFLDVLKKGIEIVKDIASAFQALPAPVKTFIIAFGGILALLSQLAPLIAAVVTIVTTVGAAPIAIVLAIVAAVAAAIAIFQNWGAVTDWLGQKWEEFKAWATELWNSFKDWFGQMWEGVKSKILEVWNGIVTWLSAKWQGIKDVAGIIFNGIKDGIAMAFQATKENVTGVWNAIKNFFSTVWNGIKNIASSAANAVKNTVTNVWNGIKNVTSTIWNGIKAVIQAVWNTIKALVTTAINGIKGIITNVWNAIKTVTSSVWNGVKSVIETAINGAKNIVSNVVNGIKNLASNAWQSVKNTASNTWEGIKNAITSPIERARDTISNIVQGIKNMFDFKLSFPQIEIPHIPLPHFEISGSFNPLKGEVPGIGINWYAKGGLFNSPSVIGVGEAGKEAVLPLKDKVLGKIGSMIANTITTDQMSGTNATPSIINLQVDWQGDIDSPDRINQLTDRITEVLTDSQRDGFH